MQLESTTTSTSTIPAATTTTNAIIPSAEESIAKLEAVAMALPSAYGVDGNSIWRDSESTRSALATTLLNADDLEDDDDDFEDDFDEDDSIPCYSPLRYPCTTSNMTRNGYITSGMYTINGHHKTTTKTTTTTNRPNFLTGYPRPNYYSEPYPQQNCSRTPYNNAQYANRSLPMNHPYGGWSQHNLHHNYYGPTLDMVGEQQTIRCAENGKSYLELGSSNFMSTDNRQLKRCCDGRNGIWCNNNKQCYRERRLKMRNLSMFKLSRFRQPSEQSLYRSVLICNTLKYIDREIEQENKDNAATQHDFHAHHHYVHSRLNNNTITSNGAGCGDMRLQQIQHHHGPPNGNNRSWNTVDDQRYAFFLLIRIFWDYGK